MVKKKRIGKDPLESLPWIGVGPEVGLEKKPKGKQSDSGKQRKRSKQGTPGLPDITKSPTPQRQTYFLSPDLITKIKAYAYWERMGISDVVNRAIEEFFEGKTVKDIPQNVTRVNIVNKKGAV